MSIDKFRPETEVEILEIIKLAQKSQQSIHCYSAGFNWGYGTNVPIDINAIQLDLSKMNKIISFDENLGLLKIEPGVTQGQLLAFLESKNLDYYVPNTGAGHRGSILGNALERGFGISPIHDHASSILSVRGLLSDGSIYESALKEVDHFLADCFPWGIGPQLDKMISQSSWIVITEVTIQLKKKHQCTDLFFFSFDESEFKNIILFLRAILAEDEGHIGSIKIFNRRQILSPEESQLSKLIFKKHEWFMTIIIYSNDITRSSILKWCRTRVRKFTNSKISFLNSRKINILINLMSFLPKSLISQYCSRLIDLKEMLKLAEGKVSEVGFKALDVSFDYLKEKEFDFSKFNKNLIWLSPLCPLDPDRSIDLLNLVERLNSHERFRFNTFTWTVLNQRTLALVIPILYQKEDDPIFWDWYKDIHRELKNEGFIPYRFHNKMMEMVRNELIPNYYRHVKKFEKSMDPEEMILKGRY